MEEFFRWLSSNPVATTSFIVAFGVLVTSTVLIYLLGFFQGREISLWPPKIGAKPGKKPKTGELGKNRVKDARLEGVKSSGINRCKDPDDCIVRVIKSRSELEAIFRFPDDNDSYLDALSESECLLEGHFRLVSGKHSSRFIRFGKILENPLSCDYFVKKMATSVSNIPFTRIIGSAGTAGGTLAREIGKVLNITPKTFHMEYGKRKLDIPGTRAKELFGHRCLYVDDLATTGGGVISAIDALLEKGIVVVAVAVCFVRDKNAASNLEKYLEGKGIEFTFLGYADLAGFTWDEKKCKLCQLVFSQDMN